MIVNQIADHYERMRVLKRIAVAQTASGDQKGAKQTLAAIDRIISNKGDPFRALPHVRELFFTAQVEAGFVGGALKSVRLLEKGARGGTYREIGGAMQIAIHEKNGRVWDISKAIELAQTIDERWVRVSLLSGIVALTAKASQ